MKTPNKNFQIDMCNGPVFRKMLLFSLPLMLSSILQLLFNAADIVVVGQFAGDDSLAAVGSTGSLVNLLVNLFIGLSVGANVMAARHYGAKHEDALSRTVHTAMKLAIYSGIMLSVIGIAFTEGILKLMRTPDDVLPLAALYLRIYFGGMLANMIYNFGSAILRAVGDTRRPMYYLSFAGVVNVVLNLLFVIVFKMDVAGVALATVISQCISAFLVVRCMMREKGSIALKLSELRIDRREFMGILRIGLPAGFQGIIFSLSNVVIQSSINGFGQTVVAGSAASANIEGFVYVAMNAFYQSTISFISQNYGAHKFARIRKTALYGQLSVMVIGIVLGNLILVFGRQLLGLYSSEQPVIEAGFQRMQIMCILHFFCGMMDVMVGILRGIGYSIMPMIVSLLGACGFRLIWIATVFQIERFHTIEVVYWSYPVSWMLTFLIHVLCFMIVRRKVIPKWVDEP